MRIYTCLRILKLDFLWKKKMVHVIPRWIRNVQILLEYRNSFAIIITFSKRSRLVVVRIEIETNLHKVLLHSLKYCAIKIEQFLNTINVRIFLEKKIFTSHTLLVCFGKTRNKTCFFIFFLLYILVFFSKYY